MLINLGLIFISLVLLYYGGEFLVSGSLRLAQSFKLSPFIIGATVMGFGTSAPELAVSVIASLHGSGELALGNIIGSNIANIGLVLGLTTLIIPLTIEKSRFKNESPSLIITSLIIVIFSWDSYVSRIEGIILISLLFIYLWKAFRTKETIEIDLTQEYLFQGHKRPVFYISLVVLGIIMLVAGANWMVAGASSIARKLGISEWFIGVSIVAIGTSLPELISSLTAAKKGHGEMAIGNVFGSNIFNILMVVGAASSVQPLNIHQDISADLTYTTLLTVLLLLLIWHGHALKKRDGIILSMCYCSYLGLKGSGLL